MQVKDCIYTPGQALADTYVQKLGALRTCGDVHLVGGAVLSQADGVVCHDVDDTCL